MGWSGAKRTVEEGTRWVAVRDQHTDNEGKEKLIVVEAGFDCQVLPNGPIDQCGGSSEKCVEGGMKKDSSAASRW